MLCLRVLLILLRGHTAPIERLFIIPLGFLSRSHRGIEEIVFVRLKVRILDDGGRDEDKQVVSLPFFGVAAKGAAQTGNVAKERNLGYTCGKAVRNQATQHQGESAGDQD